jgi:hypothetical protein
MRGAFRRRRPINRSSERQWFSPGTLLADIEVETTRRRLSAEGYLDIGTNLHSPTSPDNDEKAPFVFGDKIENVQVQNINMCDTSSSEHLSERAGS